MSVYTPDNFAGRVNHACAVMLAGRSANRAFDTCFEMYDGAAVVLAIHRRAQGNAELRAALPRYLCPIATQATVEKHGHRKPAELAAELRAQGLAAFKEMCAKIAARKAEQVAA
jgi:hypothetical protein